MKHLMSGNEATARGVYEAGIKVCSAYPGTPSTEILENLPQYGQEVYCEWAPNEKVATEVAYGASVAGSRAFCTMKMVGLNVAADPLFTAGYMGVNGAYVVVTADDPSCHSSQNEQDSRHYAEAAKYFDMAVKMNYNVDDSYVGEAMAYRNLNKTEEFLTTVKEGLKVIPDGNKNKTNLEKLLYGYCIKQGQAAQKKGDLAGAEKMYKEVLAVSNKDYQSNAYYSLGAMLYGNGAKILQAATPIATSEPDKYNAEKAKADKDFKQAKEYLTKAVELDPKDENSKKILASINDILK
mgnify:CR=1 FL=1